MIPDVDTRPTVGLNPTMRWLPAGHTIEFVVSVPTATAHMFAAVATAAEATAASLPSELDGPGRRSDGCVVASQDERPSPGCACRRILETAIERREGPVKHRTADEERRSGIHYLIFGTFFLALMFGAWWLVESTNKEGEHDAQLLPFFALIPLLIGVYHLARSRVHRV